MTSCTQSGNDPGAHFASAGKMVIQTHVQVGKEVRQAIARIGGTMPENIPPAEPIKQAEKRLKESTPKLQLDGPDAKGLTGGAEGRK